MKAEDLKTYESILKKTISIGDFKTGAEILRHKKTGAKVVLMENDDDNKVFYVAFRTPPANSYGVPHILEHSVLCGSKKFPLKDPFVELVKGSPNTFLNAITYPDMTVYPVASCNEKDFQNLMDVYLDAVFHPNIYQNKAIFLQEGWHYELDEDGKLSYNGVVYNEMKGAFSDIDEIINREVQNGLYPDTPYGVESGGDPEQIPNLTYEDFLAFHQKFYHPSNCYIYLYGNMDMAEKLDFIDKEYLSAYDFLEVDSKIKAQEPFAQPRRVEKFYPVEEDEDETEKTCFSISYSVGDNLDPELNMAFQVLERILINNNGSPLQKALLDAELGSEVYGSYDNGIKQPYFSIYAKDAAADREEEFFEIVRTTLEKTVKEGFDKKAILASLNSLEFKYLEADFGRFPKGLMYGLNMLSNWIQDELSPFVHLDGNKIFSTLREKAKTDYFEKLVSEYLLNNKHGLALIMKPQRRLLDQKEKELSEELARIKAGMTQEQLAGIKKDYELLEAFRETEDTKEALESLPMLTREDLGKEAAKIYNEERNIDQTPFLYHDIFTNGIGYLTLSFDLKDVPEEYYKYVGLLRLAFFDMSTERYDYGDLSNEMDYYSGGMNVGFNVVNRYDNPDNCRTFLSFATKYMVRNARKVVEILTEVMLHTIFEDEKRLLDVLREYKTSTQQSMMSAGNVVAVDRALSYGSMAAAYSDVLSRYSFYRLVCEVEENFDEIKGEIISKMTELTKMILRPENLSVDYTGGRENLEELESLIRELKGMLHTEEDVKKGQFIPVLEKKNEGFMGSSQVQYVCLAGNFRKKGLPYDGSLRALKIMLSYEYLWMNVRVKNGAYGCSCNFTMTGDGYIASYRDPQLVKTLEIYHKTADYVRNFRADERTMTKYIIGAIGEMDIPMTPSVKGSYSRGAYNAGLTQEDLQGFRDELLATTPEKIRKLACYVEAFLEDDLFVTVGNSQKLKENEKLFGKLENLF